MKNIGSSTVNTGTTIYRGGIKLTLKKELILDDLTLSPGDVVDGMRAKPKIYKIFVRNGWWAIPAEYFTEVV